MDTILDLLQDRKKFIGEIAKGIGIEKKIRTLLVIVLADFAVYGFIMGMSNSFLQALASMIKLPFVYLITTAICYPTFFIFYSLFGSKTSAAQSVTFLLTASCVISLILLAFAPVVLFFLLTAHDYLFFKLLNVLFFSISGIVGISFFYKMITSVDAAEGSPEENKANSYSARNKFLFCWLILYAFVGTQLAWTFRPFFGAPDMPFEFIRQLGGNFYTDVLRSIFKLFTDKL